MLLVKGCGSHAQERPCPFCVAWDTVLRHMQPFSTLTVLGFGKKKRKEVLLPGAVRHAWAANKRRVSCVSFEGHVCTAA